MALGAFAVLKTGVDEFCLEVQKLFTFVVCVLWYCELCDCLMSCLKQANCFENDEEAKLSGLILTTWNMFRRFDVEGCCCPCKPMEFGRLRLVRNSVS